MLLPERSKALEMIQPPELQHSSNPLVAAQSVYAFVCLSFSSSLLSLGKMQKLQLNGPLNTKVSNSR